MLLGNGNGTFQAAVNYAAGTSPHSVAVGDFNGDGKADLAVANSDSNNVSVLLGTWVPASTTTTLVATPNPSTLGQTSDADGHGFALGGHGPGDVLRRHHGAGRGYSGQRNGDVDDQLVAGGQPVLRASYGGDATYLASTSVG